MPTYFCPCCFVQIPATAGHCPACGCDIADQDRRDYDARLLHSLRHPESEVRMAAILSLGRRATPNAVGPLLDCLQEWPEDVVQGEEILRSLARIRRRHGADPGLAARIDAGFDTIRAHHPSRVIRNLARGIDPHQT